MLDEQYASRDGIDCVDWNGLYVFVEWRDGEVMKVALDGVNDLAEWLAACTDEGWDPGEPDAVIIRFKREIAELAR